MWKQVVSTILVGITSLLAYLVYNIIQKRKLLAGYPQPPMKNLLLGHLEIADECRKVFPKSAHIHLWPDYIREKYNLPEIYYIDWRPFGPLWVHIADPEFAHDYITMKQSLPKSPYEVEWIVRFLGENNMVTLEGQHWKMLRTMFNPGFSATNIMTYMDSIVEAGVRFDNVLRQKAKTSELFELEEYATRLTVDIIGVAVFDVDLKAQEKLHPIVQHFRERVNLMPDAEAVFPWQDVQVTRPFRLWWNNRKMEQAIEVELEAKILRRAEDLRNEAKSQSKSPKKRSIIDLALNAYEKEIAMGENMTGDAVKHITDLKQMPLSLKQDIVDSIKTFFFAGHDTTSSTIAWCFYLLHRYPNVQQKLTTELNTFFPPGTSTADKIKQDPHIINKLEYTTAVIKETMRIFPPASTLRAPDPKIPYQATMKDRHGQDHFINGTHLWPVAHLMHRNRRFFPNPTEFIPERFIPSQTPFPDAELFEPAGKYAFQPFSIGPRNCIGQELAMIETRVIVALTAREFDFVLEYPGEEADPQPPIPKSTAEELAGDTHYGRGIRNGTIKPKIVEGHRVWPTLKGTAKPNGGCPGRIKLR